MGGNRKTWTDDDMRALVAGARRMAQGHPHAAVRMFVFKLCRALERLLNDRRREARRAAAG